MSLLTMAPSLSTTYVSYNNKHNEANGEENGDVNSDNRSWNYGAEGPPKTRRSEHCDGVDSATCSPPL